MNRKAFTMIELVFVIVVVGILALMAFPRLDRDTRQEGLDNILSAILLTQHLALVDDKTDPRNALWQKELWTIKFSSVDGEYNYSIYSDTNHNEIPEREEATIDTSSGAYIFDDGDGKIESGESASGFLYKYGVSNIAFDENCPTDHLAFDRFGRLFSIVNTVGATPILFEGYQSNDCVMTISFVDGAAATITIEAETGYAKLIN